MKKTFLTCQDYTVSNELFDLLIDQELEMLITSPQPKKENLSKYYKSEKYISHTDSRNTFFDKVYQTVKRYSVFKKVKLINRLVDSRLNKKGLLDIGCGTGDFLRGAQKSNWEVTGIEPNNKARKISELKISKKIFSTIEELGSEKYDVITLWHVLEHIPNILEYIAELKKRLKNNGTIIIAVPNYKSYDAEHYGKFWAAYDVPRHLWHFSKTSIKKIFNKEKMCIIKTLPMLFDSFYVSLLSEKNKTGKQNPLKAFFIGFWSNFLAIQSKEYSSHIYILKNTIN